LIDHGLRAVLADRQGVHGRNHLVHVGKAGHQSPDIIKSANTTTAPIKIQLLESLAPAPFELAP
jgi:hypothetical protein